MTKTIQTGPYQYREYDGSDDYDRSQVWETPGYSRLDLHMSYKLPKVKGLDMTLNGHIFNVLDEVFVQDAVDNSRYNSWGSKEHPHISRSILGNTKIAKHWFDNQLLIIRGW